MKTDLQTSAHIFSSEYQARAGRIYTTRKLHVASITRRTRSRHAHLQGQQQVVHARRRARLATSQWDLGAGGPPLMSNLGSLRRIGASSLVLSPDLRDAVPAFRARVHRSSGRPRGSTALCEQATRGGWRAACYDGLGKNGADGASPSARYGQLQDLSPLCWLCVTAGAGMWTLSTERQNRIGSRSLHMVAFVKTLDLSGDMRIGLVHSGGAYGVLSRSLRSVVAPSCPNSDSLLSMTNHGIFLQSRQRDPYSISLTYD